MNLFKKPKRELPPLITDEELDGASYEQVIDFLTAVNDKDYFKIIKVAEVTRIHNAGIYKITGMKPPVVPSIFEREEQPVVPIAGDTELGDFLTEDDKPKGKKVTRKNAKH